MATTVDHFTVTHPLGMHARVCARWIKIIQKIRPANLPQQDEWAWIAYKGSKISAESLFKLLEARIPYGAKFDLVLDENCLYDAQVKADLAFVISVQSFDRRM
ncbi:MAG: HPr family phosphocarrier protein [Holosporales bacterium]|jgi:phosphotransferase system HPr-like phosphotransfer protein|nr:HPr family phosphocarrier protein [Holosporales bacterium]